MNNIMLKVIIPSSVVGSLFVFGKHYHKNYKYDFENEQINKHIIDWKKNRDEEIHREIANGITEAINKSNFNKCFEIKSYRDTITNTPTDEWYFNVYNSNIKQVLELNSNKFSQINIIKTDFHFNNRYLITLKPNNVLEIELGD